MHSKRLLTVGIHLPKIYFPKYVSEIFRSQPVIFDFSQTGTSINEIGKTENWCMSVF